MNGELGQKTTAGFQEKYGTPQAMFMKCDTTSQTEMEGRIVIR